MIISISWRPCADCQRNFGVIQWIFTICMCCSTIHDTIHDASRVVNTYHVWLHIQQIQLCILTSLSYFFCSFLDGCFLDSLLICRNLQKEKKEAFSFPRIAAGCLSCRSNWTSKAIVYNIILIPDMDSTVSCGLPHRYHLNGDSIDSFKLLCAQPSTFLICKISK